MLLRVEIGKKSDALEWFSKSANGRIMSREQKFAALLLLLSYQRESAGVAKRARACAIHVRELTTSRKRGTKKGHRIIFELQRSGCGNDDCAKGRNDELRASLTWIRRDESLGNTDELQRLLGQNLRSVAFDSPRMERFGCLLTALDRLKHFVCGVRCSRFRSGLQSTSFLRDRDFQNDSRSKSQSMRVALEEETDFTDERTRSRK